MIRSTDVTPMNEILRAVIVDVMATRAQQSYEPRA